MTKNHRIWQKSDFRGFSLFYYDFKSRSIGTNICLTVSNVFGTSNSMVNTFFDFNPTSNFDNFDLLLKVQKMQCGNFFLHFFLEYLL